MPPDGEPGRDCALCPRLAAYRAVNRAANPGWFNAPVPSFGPLDAPLLIVGMAPGVKGANRTGRPFTGDHAGILLYETLLRHGLARGAYLASADDGLELVGCRIVNAVRCVPPANLPEPAEVATCNRFLAAELARMPALRTVLALGVLAHAAVLRACGIRPSRVAFAHGAIHALDSPAAPSPWGEGRGEGPAPPKSRVAGLRLADSYHVSRYNTSTRRLTPEMFDAVIGRLARSSS